MCGHCDNCHDGRSVADAGAVGPFPVHSTVRHAEWGPGMVMGYEEDRMTVLFDEVGYKTLSVPVVSEQGLLVAEALERVGRVPRQAESCRDEEPRTARSGFSDAEWGLLVGLPQSVLTAASAAESRRHPPDPGRERRRPGGDRHRAGVGQPAGHGRRGRAGRPGRRPGDRRGAAVDRAADPAAYADDVLGRAREAAPLLASRTDEGEAGAYKHWLVTIAEQVVTASPSGGILGVGGDVVTELGAPVPRPSGVGPQRLTCRTAPRRGCR